MAWTEDYFSKFEFIIHCGYENFGYFSCNLIINELSYQECGNTGFLVFEHSQRLSKRELSKMLPYILLSNFEHYRKERIPLEEDMLVGFRDEFSITFKGYSQDGQELLTYEMMYVYKDWYNQPVDKLYSYISETYFSKFQKERCFIAHGLMASVHPF